MTRRVRIGALISGTGTNLQAIIDACDGGSLSGQIVFIGADNPGAAGLARGRRLGIPTFVVDYRKIIASYGRDPQSAAVPDDFDLEAVARKQTLLPAGTTRQEVVDYLTTRAIAEKRLLEAMAPYDFDVLVLAGFMRMLTPYFIDRVNVDSTKPRILNIHPALLPAFPGTDGYGDAFRFGCKVAGCTVHFVDYGEDTGPIVGQQAFSIDTDDTLEKVREKGLQLEWGLYPQCIDFFARGRLKTVKTAYTDKDGRQVERTVVRILPGEEPT